MPVVKFIKEKIEITVPEGANLRQEAVKAGVNLNQAVTGVTGPIDALVASVNKYVNCSTVSCGLISGSCGTCRVNIVKGIENTNKFTTKEWVRFRTPLIPDPLPALAYVGNEGKMRLACCTTVHGDIEVESGPALNLFGENFFS
jgi:ferredoxin